MKIGVLFPGYSSQYIGMAKDLYDDSRIVQEYFEEASNCLSTNFVKLCFASSDTELSRIDNAYTSIFLVSSALFAFLKEQGIQPYLISGYNQGEFAALHAAGCFTFPDGLYLLSKYASLYTELLGTVDVNGIRISGIEFETLQEICKKISKTDRWVHIALQNLPKEHIVMGHLEAVERLREHIIEYPEIEMYDADVELGLHAACMESVVASLKIYSEKVDFNDLNIPIVTNAFGSIVTQGVEAKAALMKQIESMVKWSDCLLRFADCDLIIEVGPGTSLTDMVKKMYPEKLCKAINNKDDVKQLGLLIAQHRDEKKV